MNRSKGYGLIRNGDLCIWVWSALCVGPLVRIKLVHEGAEASFQLKWGQITHKPLIPGSCTEVSAPCSLSKSPGSRDAPSSAYHDLFSKHTKKTFFSPSHMILLSISNSVFPPAHSSRSCQATCVTRGSGKKGFKTHWHASPKSIFGERSFFLWKQKSHREK